MCRHAVCCLSEPGAETLYEVSAAAIAAGAVPVCEHNEAIRLFPNIVLPGLAVILVPVTASPDEWCHKTLLSGLLEQGICRNYARQEDNVCLCYLKREIVGPKSRCPERVTCSVAVAIPAGRNAASN